MTNLDTTFQALADPTRRAILARLASGEASVLEIAKPFAMSQPAISRHIGILERAGLITRRIEGSKRPCALSSEGLIIIDEWLSLLRESLARNYDRLDRVLEAQRSQRGGPEIKQ